MIKKLAGAAVAGAVFLGATLPAFASFDQVFKQKSWLKVYTKSYVNTGENTIMAYDDVKGGVIHSGPGYNYTDVANFVNRLNVDCECLEDDALVKQKSWLKVYTKSYVNTGENTIHAHEDVEGGVITTGGGANDTYVLNVVNTFGEDMTF